MRNFADSWIAHRTSLAKEARGACCWRWDNDARSHESLSVSDQKGPRFSDNADNVYYKKSEPQVSKMRPVRTTMPVRPGPLYFCGAPIVPNSAGVFA